MNWGKVILIFQAIITLIIGMVFFSQTVTLSNHEIDELRIQITNPSILNDGPDRVFIDVKKRFTSAAYILGLVSILELIILSRL